MSGHAGGDRQALMVRRAIALGVGLLVIFLIVVGISSCLDSRRRTALKTYADDVKSLVTDSGSQVSQPFFTLLAGAASKNPVDVEVGVNQYKATASDEVHRAQGLSVPGEMSGAQRSLLLSLDLRSEGLAKIAARIRTALGTRGALADDAVTAIAGDMEQFLASDVIYSQRVAPLITQVLNDNGIHDVSVGTTQFLSDLAWLSPATVRSRLNLAGSSAGSSSIASGSHGHALLGVSAGGISLLPSPTVNRIAGAGNVVFTVKLANQGSNDEVGVKVDITITGVGAPIAVSKTLDRTKAGLTATVDIPLSTPPPTGSPVQVSVAIEGVPGEKTLSNNKQAYTAIFSR